MAEQEPHSLASTFPSPPSFWKGFTPDRLARLDELRRAAAEKNDGEELPAIVPDLPSELLTLQPPPEPSNGRWRVFGDQYMLNDKLPTLEEQGMTNLSSATLAVGKDVKHYDRALELKRLAKSLILNFLELGGTMARTPSHAEAKIQDVRTIFINMHHILNEYRPHQARESAIEMMQDHLDRLRTETVAVRTQVDKARRVLEGLGSLSIPTVPEPLGEGDCGRDADDVALQREADMWAAVDAAFA